MKDEATLIATMRRLFAGACGDEFLDDGAALPTPKDHCDRVVTADVVVEGVHFSFALSSPESAGHRAIIQNVSDLAAMGAKPVGFVWTLAIPHTLLAPDGSAKLTRFLTGAADAARQEGLPLFGGDLSATDGPLCCSVSAFGDALRPRPVRAGAQPGDKIIVGKCLGASAAGLRALLDGEGVRPPPSAHLQAHEFPTAQIALGQVLGPVATAMMDISDGLALDLHRLMFASGVGARLSSSWTACIAEGATREDALFGGEDYALLATVPPTIDLQDPTLVAALGADGALFDIGEIDGSQQTLVDAFGTTIAPLGYDHFAKNGDR